MTLMSAVIRVSNLQWEGMGGTGEGNEHFHLPWACSGYSVGFHIRMFLMQHYCSAIDSENYLSVSAVSSLFLSFLSFVDSVWPFCVHHQPW